MYGDFSRMTYSRANAYSAVWWQQGRVQLDADPNEQTAILLDWLRTLAIDFIGPFGGHAGNAGFEVKLQGNDLTFKPGHYYVHGLRCEVPSPPDGSAPAYRDLVPTADPLPKPPYVVVLFVWERSVSAVTAPHLLEPALGPYPPDTTVRSQVAWMPMISTLDLPATTGTPITPTTDLNHEDLSNKYKEHNDRVNSRPRAEPGAPVRPRLAARVDNQVVNDEASIVPASAGYLGVENQLYRVEIHRSGAVGQSDLGPPTFKWSRHNGFVEFRITHIQTDNTGSGSVNHVTLTSLGRDQSTSLDVGNWVEVIDDTTLPLGQPHRLLDVRAIDRAKLTVTLGGEIKTQLGDHPYLRRWDQLATGAEDADGIAVVEGAEGNAWLELEDGVQVAFQAAGAEYMRGDFWLIPARTATGGLLWPGGSNPTAVPPHGPDRYLAPLALVTATNTVEDLRSLFTNLAWPDS
jgi:hypothetical protein